MSAGAALTPGLALPMPWAADKGRWSLACPSPDDAGRPRGPAYRGTAMAAAHRSIARMGGVARVATRQGPKRTRPGRHVAPGGPITGGLAFRPPFAKPPFHRTRPISQESALRRRWPRAAPSTAARLGRDVCAVWGMGPGVGEKVPRPAYRPASGPTSRSCGEGRSSWRFAAEASLPPPRHHPPS